MSTWNPLDKDTSITLSNTNHTATAIGGSDTAVRGTTSHTTGRYYLEYTVTQAGGLRGVRGFAASTQSLTTPPPPTGTLLHAFGLDNGGNSTVGGGSGAGNPTGHVVCLAIDMNAGKYWGRYDGGAWFGSGTGADPATGVNGLNYTTVIPLGTPIFAYTVIIDFGTRPVITINAGDTAFAQAIPGGFVAWDAPAPTPIDGSKIFEVIFKQIDDIRYQTSDYDSIWSRGDRVANGLMTADFYGFPGVTSAASQGFNNNYGAVAGDGPTPTGKTTVPYMPGGTGAMWFDFGAWSVELRGIEWMGGQDVTDDSVPWKLVGGLNNGATFTESYTLEMDGFSIFQHVVDTYTTNYHRVLEFTPRVPTGWPHYEIVFMNTQSYAGNRMGNEWHLRVSHSILDGGDRRSSNGNPAKQVLFSMSSNWTFVTSTGVIDPANALFDGKYHRLNTKDPVATKNGEPCAALRAVSGSTPWRQSTAGEWLEFDFPRPVRMRHIVFNLANTTLEAYTSGAPQHYLLYRRQLGGRRRKQRKRVTACSTSWRFKDALISMPFTPGVGTNAGFDTPDDGGHTKWRMVLDTGPAFGSDLLLAQIIFNVDDPGGQSAILNVGFTDDTDGALPELEPVAPGSPYVILLSDGTTDGINMTLTSVPNLLLSALLTDGDTDVLEVRSDLLPSVVTQTFTMGTGS